MWQYRKSFAMEWSKRSSFSTGSDSLLDNATNPFITALKYCIVPFSSDEEWRATSVALFCTPSDASDEDWREWSPPNAEYFVVGLSSGAVVRVGVFPSALELRDPDSARQCICEHSEDVMAIDTLGTLVASVSCDGTFHIASYYPTCVPLVSNMPRDSDVAGLRCCRLWEGKREWDNQTEASTVYLFTGDDNGLVKLWRVELLNNSCRLIAVYGCISLGADGSSIRAAASSSHPSSAAPCRITKPIFSIALDVEEADPPGKCLVRLVVGTERQLFVWYVEGWPSQQQSEETAEVAPRAPSSLVDWEETSLLSKYLNHFVWLSAPLLVPSSMAPEGTLGKRLLQVQQRCSIGCVVNTSVVPRPGGGTRRYHIAFPHWKKPLEVSPCANTTQGTEDVSEEAVAVGVVQSVITPVVLPECAFLGDKEGPVYQVTVLSEGFLATGGSDGAVRLWVWNLSEAKYLLAQIVEGAHRDAVRCIDVISHPSMFVTGGLDGMVHAWNLGEGLSLWCRESLALTETIEADREAVGLRTLRGVCAICVFPQFGALFVALHMTNCVRSFVWSAADTCALPPSQQPFVSADGGTSTASFVSYHYNGERTVVLREGGEDREGGAIFGDVAGL